MNKKQNDLAFAAVSLVLGILLVFMKGSVISIALTVAGVALIISAVFDILHSKTTPAIIKGVIGVCILVFGWLFINLALYIVGGFMIASGLMQIIGRSNKNSVRYSQKQETIELIKSIALILTGACLLFNQGAAIDWVFIVTGALFIVQGVLGLAEAAKKQ